MNLSVVKTLKTWIIMTVFCKIKKFTFFKNFPRSQMGTVMDPPGGVGGDHPPPNELKSLVGGVMGGEEFFLS